MRATQEEDESLHVHSGHRATNGADSTRICSKEDAEENGRAMARTDEEGRREREKMVRNMGGGVLLCVNFSKHSR
jgi:hypothetical protein